MVDGLVQTPTTDYTITGTSMQLTSAPALNSNVVVRYPMGVSSALPAPGSVGMAIISNGSNWTSRYLDTDIVNEITNLYYTNARVAAFVTPNLNLKANVSDLTTSNVTEGNNQYFTNTRARSALSSGTGVSYNTSTGVISIGQKIGRAHV